MSQPVVELPRTIKLRADAMRDALQRLSTAERAERIDAVAVGSPHFSVDEFSDLHRLLEGKTLSVPFYVCTARDTLAEVDDLGWTSRLVEAGVEIVADTCVVVTPILPAKDGVLMTNSGKFAHYGPSNTGYEVVYGSLEDCVDSAVSGDIVRNQEVWAW